MVLRLFYLIGCFACCIPCVDAASLTIPANCALNINSCTVNVPGDVTNAGTLQTSTGTISLTGNWLNSGTFTSGSGTVVFSATSGTQTLDTGGLANAFYNLTHSGAGTLQLMTNLVDVNNTLTNSAGTLDANSINVRVGKDWDNTAAFTPGTNTIIFDGTNQQVLGSTTFYNLTKQVASADTLTFSDTGASPSGQTVTNFLTLTGAASNVLSIRSTADGTYAKLKLQAGGAQSILNVNVKDSDASGGTQLVARGSSVNSNHNLNWSFSNVTLTWQGADAHPGADKTDWDNPFNWDLGLVPAPGDSVVIPATASQPVLNSAASVGNLTVQAGAVLTLNGYDLTVSTTFSNDGNVKAKGNETITLTQDTDSGTFTYVGNGDGTQDTRTININGLAASFFNVVINDPNATKDIFQTNGALTVHGALTVTAGTLNTSTNSNAVTATGTITVDGGTWTATNSTIDANGSVVISNGTLTAPNSTANTAFTVAGDWTHSGGTFTPSNGKVTFDGTNQHLYGSTTFYRFRKVVAAADTFTFDHTGTQVFTNDLTMTGASGQLLSLRSTADGVTQAAITLNAGATQSLDYLNVKDSNASGGLELVGHATSTNAGNNIKWTFGGTTMTWDGSTSTDWEEASNWDLGIRPNASDTAVIANVATQPTLTVDAVVNNLTLNANSALTLAGKNLQVVATFSNNGNIIAQGNETIQLTPDTDSGTFTYVGNGDGTQDTRVLTISGSTSPSYYHLVINDPNATKDIIQANGAISVYGDVTVTQGTLDASNAATTMDINGSVTINGGTLIAPPGQTNTTFTIGGNFAHSSGIFTHSSGKVTFDGANQSISGDSTFYQLRKVTAVADTFTFAANATQTITNSLTLTGASGQLLSLRSSINATQTNLNLQTGGLQTIQYVDVQDNQATGLRLVGRDASPASSTQNNTNWSFGNVTLTWTGTSSTDFDTGGNWNLGVAPITGDTVIVAPAGNQPLMATNINVVDLTLQANTTLTLNGKDITVSGVFSNDGNVKANGTENISLTQDTDSGTWTYVGDANGSSDTRTIKDFGASDYYHLVINDPNVTKDIFSASGQNLDINGNFSITAGTFIAPDSTHDFTLAGSFANTGTFTHSSGTVTLDTTNPATISGNTTFYNFASTAGGKTITFADGSTQTINGTFNFSGQTGNKIILNSQTSGVKWSLAFPNGEQNVSLLNVKDADALNKTVMCFNCTDSGNNNANWVFATLTIDVPSTGKTVNTNPTIIGTAVAGSTVKIRRIVLDDATDPIVATTVADASGNFMVRLGNDDANTGLVAANTALVDGATVGLRPWIIAGGTQTYNLTVNAAPGSALVPTIVSPNTARIRTSTPTIIGSGAANQAVSIRAKDKDSLDVRTVASGTTDASSGAYSIIVTTALRHGYNYLAVVIDGVASDIVTVGLVDPFGVVFDSSSSQAIKNASVAIYRASDHQLAVPGVDLDASDTNPFVTDTDGQYGFLTVSGMTYYMVVNVSGYQYPSKLSTFPLGRTIVAGSKGEQFTVGTTIIEMDHPVDGTGFLLRLEKDANKKELRVGDVITYTIKIQNLSGDNQLNNFLIEDKIPPGFKYLPNRVLLDGVPLSEPEGQRPLVFTIPTINPGAIRTLRYQLVVGSGVTQGKYENIAIARYPNTGVIISNRTTRTVKVVMDPLFDMGTVIGKVFWDFNENGKQDAPVYDATEMESIIEKPVPNVQIVTEDGAVITTDREGKFNLGNILPGRHIFRVDERTLPPGAFLTTDKAVVVDITNGSLAKVNFGVNMDNAQVVGRDAQFFNERIALTQERNKPVPVLNVAMFGDDAPMYEGLLLRPIELRMYANYTPFIDRWELLIIDKDTKKLIKRFDGNRFNFNDPVFFNGRDKDEKIIRPDRNYAYVLDVYNDKGQRDVTVEKPLVLRVIKDEIELKKEKEPDQDTLKAKAERYEQWMEDLKTTNALQQHLIIVDGETLRLNRQGQDIKAVRVLKNGELFAEIPVSRAYGLTPQELLAGGLPKDKQQDTVDVILPNGDYTLEVISPLDTTQPQVNDQPFPEGVTPQPSQEASPGLIPARSPVIPATGLQRYTRKIKVGDDYFMFVGLGDATVGYNFNRGNIEPISVNDRYQNGFWHQGKSAYYLKGKIKGKYLVTSSFDTQREQKALFRQLDPQAYYPVYGDQSSVNYDATNTSGPLYLLVEWDKSQAIWGNYAVDFSDNQFAAFSRSFYGGKIDYQSLANNPYGDPRTKAVVFHAEVKQRPAHNEILATGGSLYFLKHKRIIEGSDHVKIEVRDKFTGLPVKTLELKNGADYELDNDEGRLLFWQPVSMIAKDLSIISTSDLANGNPIYILSDYQYEVTDKILQSSQGARVAQAIGKNVVAGATLVRETQATGEYQLKGADVLVHLGPEAKVKAEAAETSSAMGSSFVSTDGGITYSDLTVPNTERGLAYGLTGDARLFDRIGLTSYYNWVDNNFAGPSTVSTQGKEAAGLALTMDLTPVTRLTVRRDIQRLMNSGNLQSKVQVGASETTLTMAQIRHEAQRLRLTGEYQMTEVKEKKDGIDSHTNNEAAVLAGQAEYDVTDRLTLSLTQQVDVMDKTKNVTTVGANVKVTDRLSTHLQKAFSKGQQTLTMGATTQVTDKTALTTDYAMATGQNGEQATTKSLTVEQRVNNNLTATSTLSQTDSNTKGQVSAASVGAKGKINETTDVQAMVGSVSNALGDKRDTVAVAATSQVDQDTAVTTTVATNSDSTGGQSQSVAVSSTQRVDDKNNATSSIKVDENAQGGKTTTMAFGNNSKITDDLTAVTERAFSIQGDKNIKNDQKYALVRERDGRKIEGSLTRSRADEPGNISQSNIFGLTGDVNDKLALQGSLEQGKVQNLDGTQTDRMVFAVGSGYVLKDTETAVERLKNSTKVELRFDNAVENRRQFVFYNAMEGKVTDNMSLSAKLEYGNTMNTTTGRVEARHKEIILGAAYRPVNVDNLNVITQYTYKESQGPLGQADAQGIDQSRMQVLSLQGIYDMNDQWQLAEKIAYRIQEEKVTGFEFNKTHTWLMIHRLNYRVDRNWMIGGEYRKMTQVEAKDSKQGFLLEAVRGINDNVELGVGWNFSKFSDDLTNLNYVSQGPFLRMSGKLYDRTPEEKARSRARWLDERVDQWAWILVKKELTSSQSKVVEELSRMFVLANKAQQQGRLEEARQMFKDIITAGQMMFDEAAEYIRRQIAYEEKLQHFNKTATEYYKGGEFIKARKIWEKIVDDASKRMIQ